jgi:uncharacterized membrane protein
MLLDLWEFLFKYPPLVFEKGRLALTGLPGWALVGALALAGAAVWSYLRAARRLRRRDRAVLLALRAALLAVLLVALARPVLRVAVALPQENYLGVLIDDSRSMRIGDEGGGARGAAALGALDGPQGEVLDALGRRFRLRVFRFSEAAERVESTRELRFLGGRTNLGRALEQARSELAGLPLAGLVVISDGGDQEEAELNRSILALRSASVPVYTVGVGRERLGRDVEVRRASVPRAVLRGSSLVVDVVLEQTGYAGEKLPLVVEDEGRIVARREIDAPPDGTPAAVRVQFTAGESGWRRFRFRVPVQEGERVAQNNEQEALVEVRGEPQRILYFEGEPRFEVKFMRRAVEDDPQLQLVVLQRTAEAKFLRLGVDSASELQNGFPTTREELFRYRALVLGSVEAGFFTPEQLRMIADFVAERGGGLLVLGGRHSFSEGGWAGTALADVLPVELEPDADTTFFASERVTPTRAGLASPALQLAADPDSSRLRWESLPALSTWNRVTRLKPGATALLTGSGPAVPEGQVVLAAQRYGRGLVAALPVQDTWVWQMDAGIPLDDQTHETFWRQTLRWLVNGAPGQLVPTTSTERAAPREPVSLLAELRDAAYRTVNDASVEARVVGPDGRASELPLAWTAQRDGEYAARFVPARAGLHRVVVEARRGDSVLASDSLVLDASEGGAEYFDAGMRAPLLRRIAEETGGRYHTLSTLSRLPEEIRYSGSGVTETERYDLWDMPILFLLLVGLLGAEWGYRRLRGLP